MSIVTVLLLYEMLIAAQLLRYFIFVVYCWYKLHKLDKQQDDTVIPSFKD